MILNVAIVEDDKVALKKLKEAIKAYSNQFGIEVNVSSYLDVEVFLTGYKGCFDGIFMDINMPYINGMDASKRIRQYDNFVPIVFVTSMLNYAIEGYSVNAFDYIVKPIEQSRLNHVLDKIKKHKELYRENKLVIKTVGEIFYVSVKEIYFVEVMGHHCIYHTQQGDLEVNTNLSKAESELPSFFTRCNNCYLVNLNYVKSVKDDVCNVGDHALKISRFKKKEFLNVLNKHIGGGIVYEPNNVYRLKRDIHPMRVHAFLHLACPYYRLVLQEEKAFRVEDNSRYSNNAPN